MFLAPGAPAIVTAAGTAGSLELDAAESGGYRLARPAALRSGCSKLIL